MTQLAMDSRTTGFTPSWSATAVADPTAWALQLSGSDLAELDRARFLVRRSWLPMLSVRREDFPLPTLGPKLADVARRLDQAPGFFVVKGLPTTTYSEADLRLVYWGLGRHLGIAVPQDATGHLLRPADTGFAAFHSGGSDVVSLLSVDGGQTASLVSTSALYTEVARRRPDLVEHLFDVYAFDQWGEHEAGEPAYRLLPLALWSQGRLSLRYERRAIEHAQRHPGVPALTVAQRALFDLVDELLPALRDDVRLDAGDVLLVNNHEMVHRHDGAVPAPLADRRLLRIWLTLRDGRDLPGSYAWPTPVYGGETGRCGVTPRDHIDPWSPARRRPSHM